VTRASRQPLPFREVVNHSGNFQLCRESWKFAIDRCIVSPNNIVLPLVFLVSRIFFLGRDIFIHVVPFDCICCEPFEIVHQDTFY